MLEGARSSIGGWTLPKPCESFNSYEPVELNYKVTSLGIQVVYLVMPQGLGRVHDGRDVLLSA